MQKIKFKIPIKVNTRKLKELALPVEQALGRALDYLAGLTANPGGPDDFTQAGFEALREAYSDWPAAHFQQ